MAVEKGDKVKVDYEGKFTDGEVFDSSTKGDHTHPLEFEVGSGQVILGFDKGVIGMEKDQEKEITIKKENAYGDVKEELKREVPKEVLPKEPEAKAGMMLVMGTPEGQQVPCKILEIKDDKVVLDMNHPLAGKDLIFKIKILEVVKDSKD